MAFLGSFILRYLEIIPIKQFLVVLIVWLLLALIKHLVDEVHCISPFTSASRHFKIILWRLLLIIIWLCLLCRHWLVATLLSQWFVAISLGQWLIAAMLTSNHKTLLRFWREIYYLTLFTGTVWQEITVTNH